MQCVNDDCAYPQMKVLETVKTPFVTLRIYRCPICKWSANTKEELSDNENIPQLIRHLKKVKS